MNPPAAKVPVLEGRTDEAIVGTEIHLYTYPYGTFCQSPDN